MPDPLRSYVICSTPRSGSHLLADGLSASGVAGQPTERFPRPWYSGQLTPDQLDALVTQAPPDEAYNPTLDRSYIEKIKQQDMTPNGVFGTTIHWFQLSDAVRRISYYINRPTSNAHEALSAAFPELSYIWLRREDKVAQAVSWYKAIQTGKYIHLKDEQRHLPTKNIPFDYERILTYLSAAKSWDNAWKYYFKINSIKPIMASYEELSREFHKTTEMVIGKLGIAADKPLNLGAPRHRRAADALSAEWINRFNIIENNRNR